MRIVWPLLLALLRPLYFLYALLCVLALPVSLAAVAWMIAAWCQPTDLPVTFLTQLGKVAGVLFVVGAALIVWVVHARADKGDPNPWQSGFMSWFGSLKWYWNDQPTAMAKAGLPSGFLVENPRSYKIGATDMRTVLNKLRPGDIILRGYDGYLDGASIRRSSVIGKRGFRPGWFTHAALFAGEISEDDLAKVPKKWRDRSQYIQCGPQMVLHSMAMGVHSEDILTWLRCDYMVVLRVKQDLTKQHDISATTHARVDPNQQSVPLCQQIKNQLDTGNGFNLADVLTNAKDSALEMVGEPYDFQCILSDQFHRFSCAEFVYYCYRSIHDALGLEAQQHGLYPFGRLLRHFAILPRSTVTPDDYYALYKSGHLERVWIDQHSEKTA